MMHQYARLMEQTIHATVGYYISQHPSVAHLPADAVLRVFKEGPNEHGVLDTHCPDLTAMMMQLPNSRESWFSERLGIEAISRDLGEPNIFLTVNMDPRAWPDVPRLLYQLKYGKMMPPNEPFELNTERFTILMNKYAVQLSIYLYRKVNIFLRAFSTDICGIPEKQPNWDFTKLDRVDTSYYWQRVEFTETHGVQNWHVLAKLPNVLDTALLGRMIHNGRIVRQEIKCGNIKPGEEEEAWTIVEMGLLASRYAALFSDSISMSSFYTEDTERENHDEDKVVHLEPLRMQNVEDYKAGNVNLDTHPIMRTDGDPECDKNANVEMFKVAAVSCMHQCIPQCCGGDRQTGKGCRFDYPKKKLNQTVPAIMQLNAEQMEARILLRRTCDRT